MTEKIKRRGISAPDGYQPDILQSISVANFLKKANGSDMRLPHIYKTDDLGFAAEMMGKYNTDELLVLESPESQVVSGIITGDAILKYYSEQKQKDHIYQSPGQTKRIMVRGRNLFK